jgi:hypothetical protein
MATALPRCKICMRMPEKCRCASVQAVQECVNVEPVLTTKRARRTGDRHSPGYMREYMRLWRARKRGE